MYKAISESELERFVQGWFSEFPDKYPREFLDILFQLGIDKKEPVECTEDLFHRNCFNKVVKCKRWVGVERTDTAWKQSGFMSMEAIFASSDPSLQKELQSICRTITNKKPFQKERNESFKKYINLIED